MSWADRIQTALLETDDVFAALHEARKNGEPTTKLDRAAQNAANRLRALQTECRAAFARSRGWTFNKKIHPFDWPKDMYASNGARFIRPHAEYFDSLDQKLVAMVAHSAAPAQELADYGARREWRAELLPFSWHGKGYNGVVFTLKMGASWAK
jgi:hypothetical protein